MVAAGWRTRFTEKEKVKCVRGQASRKVIKVGNETIKNYDNGVGKKDSKPEATNLKGTNGGTQESIDDCKQAMSNAFYTFDDKRFAHGVFRVVGGKCRARKIPAPPPDQMINGVWERKYLPLKTVDMDRKGNHTKPREWK